MARRFPGDLPQCLAGTFVTYGDQFDANGNTTFVWHLETWLSLLAQSPWAAGRSPRVDAVKKIIQAQFRQS
jgi:hypothetical protein